MSKITSGLLRRVLGKRFSNLSFGPFVNNFLRQQPELCGSDQNCESKCSSANHDVLLQTDHDASFKHCRGESNPHKIKKGEVDGCRTRRNIPAMAETA